MLQDIMLYDWQQFEKPLFVCCVCQLAGGLFHHYVSWALVELQLACNIFYYIIRVLAATLGWYLFREWKGIYQNMG